VRVISPALPELPDELGVERIAEFEGIVYESDQNLWRRHLYMGIASFVLGGLLLLIYLALTFHGRHREAMMVIDIVAIVGSLVVVGPLGSRMVTTRWRDLFFFTWSVGTLAVIALPIGLDGGAGSPLAALLVLPVLFGGLLYRLHAVIGLALLALGCLGIILIVGGSTSSAQAGATAIMIGVAGAISATAAMNRSIWEQERRTLIESLHRLATHDGLTGCLNYQAFQDALTGEWTRARRYGRPFSVIIADLDGFKAINDQYGHGAGDDMLNSVASAMLAAVRSTDLVGRIGGDEFAVLLPETPSAEARVMVERIHARTRQVLIPRPVTLSFGISTWTTQGESAGELLHQADSALYEAKRLGRDRVATWASHRASESFR